MAVSTSSISTTVGQAVLFLTRPLVVSYPSTTIQHLQANLDANLTALYMPTWFAQEPLRGSGRRCMTLSPHCLPPRAIHQACLASGVQWFDWIAALGGFELDLFVDPGCVTIRVKGGALTTVWADEVPSPSPISGFKAAPRTFAKQILTEDDEDEIFTMIADQIRAPVWMMSSIDKMPMSCRSASPFSSSTDSRPSSRSSNSSSSSSASSRSRRDQKTEVFVDTSKTQVTPYDGGKTTVLTGGVMLGGGPKKAPVSQWRPLRVY